MGDLSAHFSRAEFSVDGRPGGRPSAHLLAHLEALRNRIGRPLPILSWKRSATYSINVVGHRSLWHERGLAVDIPGELVTVDQALAVGFTGVGYRSGWVVHLDLRTSRPLTFADRGPTKKR